MLEKAQRVHLIAVGGAVMHNMAIALKNKGLTVTGSDDAIFDPSKSRLEAHGLLPEKMGWDAARITSELDAVILGMHARPGNPELEKALALGIPVLSFPEFMFQQSQQCKRVVVAGSHGKTTITSMLLHSFRKTGEAFNYLVGSNIEGFDCMVGFNPQAQTAIFEGDEYLSSPLDRRSKFLHYKPHVAIITGLAWDHINVFPTYEGYVRSFEMLIRDIQPGGVLIYFEGDAELQKLVAKRPNPNIRYVGYRSLDFEETENGSNLKSTCFKDIDVPFFGAHNLANAESARLAMHELGIGGQAFYQSLHDYQGAARRLQQIRNDEDFTVYYDFAHAPSKVKATVAAVRQKYAKRKMTAILELHTFSSLDKKFIPFYKGAMDGVEEAIVFFDPKVLEHKNMPPLSVAEVQEAFANSNITVLNDKTAVYENLEKLDENNRVLLLMSSGNLFQAAVAKYK